MVHVNLNKEHTMTEQNERESRAGKSEKGRASTFLPSVVTGLIAALAALAGNWMIFEGGERGRALQLQEIRTKHLSGMNGDYATQKYTIRLIAALYGVRTAVELEPSFRSGATIRALEELKDKATPEDQCLIERMLAPAKRVLVIDSHLPENVYSKRTRDISGTNVDDIAERLKCYPIRIAGRKGDIVGPDNLQKEIGEHTPDVICMHLGAFEGIDYGDAKSDADKVVSFLKRFANPMKAPQVIIYSRNDPNTLNNVRSKIAQTDPNLAQNLVLLSQMQNEEGFEAGESNGDRLDRALVRLMQFDRLYTRTMQ
jgi:hypothetical protein